MGSCNTPKSVQFRFERSWLKNPDFISAVGKIWGKPCNAKSTLDRIQQKLKLIKQYFKGWGFNLQGELRKQRTTVSDELSKLETLEEIRTLSEHQVQKKMSLIRETLVLLDQEEDYWMTRCHEQWLMQGDNNTSYFHRIANGRRRKAKIISLEKEGVVIEGDNNLLKHATEYYTDLFVPEDDHEVQIDSNIWAEQPQVSREENVELSKPFSEEEIKMLCSRWKLIRLRGQTRYLLTFIKLVGL
jgi:hypothetical protein